MTRHRNLGLIQTSITWRRDQTRDTTLANANAYLNLP